MVAMYYLVWVFTSGVGRDAQQVTLGFKTAETCESAKAEFREAQVSTRFLTCVYNGTK